MSKKVFSFMRIIVVCLCLSALCFSIGASAEETSVVASGTCGEDVIWELDTEGTLTISGTGAMTPYAIDASEYAPWYSYAAQIKNVVISDGVTTVGSGSCFRLVNLQSIQLPEGIVEIEDYAFYECGIASIVIPESVQCIRYYAFYGSSLTQIVIPINVTSICGAAFQECNNLAEIIFNGDAPSIDDAVFSNVTATAYYPADNATWIEDVMQDYGGTITWVATDNEATEPDTTEPETTEPEASDREGSGCVTEIKPGVSYKMGIDQTNNGEFYYFTGTMDSYYGATSTSWDEGVYMVLEETDGGYYLSFTNASGLKKYVNIVVNGSYKNFTISDTAQTVYTWDSEYHTLLANINETICFMGTHSVYTNYSIITVDNLPYYYPAQFYTQEPDNNGNTEVPENACGANLIWELDDNGTLTISGTGAMTDYAYQSVPWYDSITEIKKIIIEESVTTIGDSAFQHGTNVQSVVLPSTLTSIGKYAFDSCKSLTAVTIPEGVTRVGNHAFWSCESLTTFVIPDAVTAISWKTFQYCSSLTSVTIGSSVTSIDDLAFDSCFNLNNITFNGSAPSFVTSVFYGVNATAYYPANNDTWTEDVMQDYGGTITWVAYGCEHEYGNWTVTVKPTFSTEGQQEKVCSLCDSVLTEVIPVAEAKVDQWNVVLVDKLQVNFYLQISKSIESTAKIKIIVGDNTTAYNVADLDTLDSGSYIAPVKLSAAQMNDYIVVMVMDGGEIGSTSTYTVWQYCQTILADESYSSYHALVKEMLNYGIMVQVYFDYEVQSLTDKDITGVAAEEVPETTDEIALSSKIDGLNFYGASLVYRDRIAVRYYFSGDITGCTFSANGSVYEPAWKNGKYYVEITDILPQNLDQQITLTVTDADGNTLSVTYGPMNYIVRMNEKSSDDLKALVKALYNYHLAAKAFQAA